VLADRLAALRDAIAMLERSGPLKADAEARLAMYRKNEQRLGAEIRELEHELVSGEWLRGNGSDARADLPSDLMTRLADTDARREAEG